MKNNAAGIWPAAFLYWTDAHDERLYSFEAFFLALLPFFLEAAFLGAGGSVA